ncbi:hypothetical protein D3C85_1389350 [compost metagenome]
MFNKVKGGLRLGEEFPLITYQNRNGDIIRINKETFKSKNIFLFLSPTCTSCIRVLESLQVYKENYLKELTLVLVTSENLELEINQFRDDAVYMEEEEVNKIFNMSVFPFVVKVDNLGEVIKQGNITKNFLIDYIF